MGSANNMLEYLAKSSELRPSTRKPVWPWSTRVLNPPTSDATTGMPHAAASNATKPKDSERLGMIKTSADLYHIHKSW